MPRQAELNRVRVVAGILIDGAGAVLIADRTRSRSMRDRWEFPGGKVAAGEPRVDALHRELREELGIEVESASHFTQIEHDYPGLSVAIDFYLVHRWRGTPSGREGQRLDWIDRTALDQANLLPADQPVVAALMAGPA